MNKVKLKKKKKKKYDRRFNFTIEHYFRCHVLQVKLTGSCKEMNVTKNCLMKLKAVE